MSNIISKNLELLAPAGNMEKLKTAFHFGADAVYLAGKQYGLRAFADNFTRDEIVEATQYAHSLGKKVYVTINIFAKNSDFSELPQYLAFLEKAQVDAVLVSDVGVMDFVLRNSKLAVHVSTQANTTNAHAVNFWRRLGAERVVLARELSIAEIKQIHELCPNVELEAFVHGAMCISYSGRCLLSNYLVNRDGNRGECVQACRWRYQVREVSREDDLPLLEDERGTYIFNSKDMNVLQHLPLLIDAGITSFKIEGRMKSVFYVATVVSAYRRALDAIKKGEFSEQLIAELLEELNKASHRDYTTGFYLDEKETRQYYEDSRAREEYKFIAVVKDVKNGIATVEQRNKFQVGDVLEILSADSQYTCKTLTIKDITDLDGSKVEVANRVQQVLRVPCPYSLQAGDVLRKKS